MRDKFNFLGKTASWLIDRYRVVYLIIIMIIFSGLYVYDAMPKESLPDIDINYVFVSTSYPGAAVEDVQSLVTQPIETKLGQMSGLIKINSVSLPSYSQVVLQFEDDADMKQAVLDVQTLVNDTPLPNGVLEPFVLQKDTGDLPIFKISLSGQADLAKIAEYANDLSSDIQLINGVRNVDISGEKIREIKLIIDESRLIEYGLTVEQVSQVLNNNNVQVPLGTTAIDLTNYSVRIDETYKTIQEIERTIVPLKTGGFIYLADIATVVDDYKAQDSKNYTFIQGDTVSTPVISMSVFRETGADIIAISEEIRLLLSTLEQELSDVHLEVTLDESEKVSDSIDTVLINAIGGLLVVVAVLYIFIGLHESMIVSIVIPMSLLISIVAMNLFGITINSVSLVAFVVALGLLVDNAIVVMENIDRYREMKFDRVLSAKKGTNEVAPAVLAATVTTICAFLPLAFQDGALGQFIGILPKTLIIAIVASFFVSIVITPNLSAKLLPKFKAHKTSYTSKEKIIAVGLVFALTFVAFMDDWQVTIHTMIFSILFAGIMLMKVSYKKESSLIEKYGCWLKQLMSSKGKKIGLLLTAFIILIMTLLTVPAGLLELELLPPEEPTAAEMAFTSPEGFLLDDMFTITQYAEAYLKTLEGVNSFDIEIGGNKSNVAVITVYFEDEKNRTGDELVDEIKSFAKLIPGAEIKVKPLSSTKRLTGDADISISMTGEAFNALQVVSNQLIDILENMTEVDEITSSIDDGLKVLLIDIDDNRANYYGLSTAYIANNIRQRISGTTVGTYNENGQSIDMTLYYESDAIQSLSDFDEIFFSNTRGEKIPFSEVASIQITESKGKIEHLNGMQVVTVTANVKESYNPSEIGRIFSKTIEQIDLPEGVTFTDDGQFGQTQEQLVEMLISFMIAIVLVYVVLVIQFNSFKQPFVILMSVPLSLIGVLIGLILTGNNLGVYAMMGVVSLVGIAVNDAIVLVDFANLLRKEGKDVKDAIVKSVQVRFLPVLATSLTTMGGVLPLALYNSTFSQLGYAIIFGLFSSTVLTLLIVPVLYFIIEERKRGTANE